MKAALLIPESVEPSAIAVLGQKFLPPCLRIGQKAGALLLCYYAMKVPALVNGTLLQFTPPQIKIIEAAKNHNKKKPN